MKPRKLVMSAFGSYAGVETIDFEQMDHGLFLIAGDTGAEIGRASCRERVL